jgi:hypothetical protein
VLGAAPGRSTLASRARGRFRTIERIVARAGLVQRCLARAPESKGLPYPAPAAEAVGDLQ